METNTHRRLHILARSPIPTLTYALLLLVCGLLFSPANWAATSLESKYKANKTKLTTTLESSQNRIGVLEKIENPDSAQKNELTWLYQRTDFIKKHLASIDRTLDLYQRSQEAPRRLKLIEQELTAPLPAKLKINKNLALNELEAQLDTLRKELEGSKRARDDIELEITQRNDRQQAITENELTARKRLDELSQFMITNYASASNPTADAQKDALLSEQAYLEQVLKELEQESLSHDNLRDLNRALRQQAERRVLIAENNYNDLEQIVNHSRSEAAAKALEIAEAANLSSDSLHPIIKEIITENQKLAEELAQISMARAALSQEKKQLNEILNTTKRRYEGIKEKITQIGLTDAIGLKLRNERKQLPNVLVYAENQKKRRAEINRVQLRRIEIEDRLMVLVDSKRESIRLVNTLDPPLNEADKTVLIDAIQNALNQQQDRYLKELISSYDIYFEKNLFPIMEGERTLISLIREYRNYIDIHILWVQSAPSLKLNNFKQLQTAAFWLFNPASITQSLGNLITDFSANTFSVLLPLFFIILLFTVGHRLKITLKNHRTTAHCSEKENFTHGLRMIITTLLVTLPIPLFFSLLAWRLTQGPAPSIYGNAIASGLSSLAYALFVGLFFHKTCRKKGLGEIFLHWNSDKLFLIKRQLNWYLPTAIPLLFIITATMDQPTQSHHDSLGRITFILLMVLTSIFIRKVTHTNPVANNKYTSKKSGGWIDKISNIWKPTFIAFPIVLMIGAVNGYVYTSVQLALYTFNTLCLIFACNIIRDLLIRALSLAQHQESAARKNNLVDTQSSAPRSDTKAFESTPVEITESDQNALSDQANKMLNSIYWVAIFTGLVFIWSEVLTAFNLLNDVILWHSVSSTDPNGVIPSTETPITLANLLLALIILILTILISQNIAGLLEIAILQRLPFTPSGRYAITSISRYIVIIIGLSMTFSAVGIGWSKVQWLAAAITLGLGFGLQEIFANFVSGLIILFERPIRIGDAVTVGNISGKITRIQMRATTITDWERKELIIPNKEFVTGQVINWSLTDTILRTLIPIGVAYGSDTQLTYNTLLDIATRHPSVLKDPEPSVRFVAFGDSTLNFELRVFVPHPDLLLEVRHDLLMEIDKRFHEVQINMPYPQRDMHIKSINQESIKQFFEIKKESESE